MTRPHAIASSIFVSKIDYYRVNDGGLKNVEADQSRLSYDMAQEIWSNSIDSNDSLYQETWKEEQRKRNSNHL